MNVHSEVEQSDELLGGLGAVAIASPPMTLPTTLLTETTQGDSIEDSARIAAWVDEGGAVQE